MRLFCDLVRLKNDTRIRDHSSPRRNFSGKEDRGLIKNSRRNDAAWLAGLNRHALHVTCVVALI